MVKDFEEIGHSGGQVTFDIITVEGQRKYQVGMSCQSPGPVVMYGLYALSFGMAVGSIHMGGIGVQWNDPPLPGCFPVLIASDSQGKFGHNCPKCNGYWRSGCWVNFCPYCALQAETHEFLSLAQQRYVRHYCDVLNNAMSDEDGKTVIDMDAVAQATRQEGEKPSFYVAEESQQYKFTCVACEEFNDILGRFGYCAVCGTRNDCAVFKDETISNIRTRVNGNAPPEDCVRDAVSAFDTFVAQYAKQLAELVAMTPRRKNRLEKRRFHNLEELGVTLKDWFDIDIHKGVGKIEQKLAARMFHRRHVYEHNGGEVDQKYLDDSGDTSVRLKQQIRETKEDAHKLLGVLMKMTQNIHEGFHELFPPSSEPIEAYEKKKECLKQHKASNS